MEAALPWQSNILMAEASAAAGGGEERQIDLAALSIEQLSRLQQQLDNVCEGFAECMTGRRYFTRFMLFGGTGFEFNPWKYDELACGA